MTLKTPLFKHPFLLTLLIGIFPIVSLIASNQGEMHLSDGLRALLLTAATVAGFYWLLNAILKDSLKASLLLALGSILFFTYGHALLGLKSITLSGGNLGRNSLLLPVYIATAIAGIWVIFKTPLPKTLIPNLTLIAVALLLMPTGQIVYAQAREAFLAAEIENTGPNPTAASDSLPDIYYIILDGYPRADVLKKSFDYDNSEFISWLASNGFVVTACSQSNYSHTRPSMASTFNMEYLGDGNPNRIAYDDDQLDVLLQYSLVQQKLESYGYTTITFETNYKWLRWSEPDYTFSPLEGKDRPPSYRAWNDFEYLLLRTTAAVVILDRINLEESFMVTPKEMEQQRILFIFEKLADIPNSIPGPKFVYAHITVPHPPYLFGQDAILLLNNPTDPIAGYRDQVDGVNTLTMNAVEAILANSPTPPIIIIQGDHGAVLDYEDGNIPPEEKLAILNAYHLPGVSENQLYPDISPINTFRLLFNNYFAEENDLLEDRSILGTESPFQKLACPLQ